MRRTLVVATVALGALVSGAAPAWAIPAFARKYQQSCTTCHAPFPRLKPFGEEFAGRGFRMPAPDQEPARATLDVGDPLLQLHRDFPIAARIEGYYAYKEDAVAQNDVEWPWVFKILSGGPIAKKMSYYVYFIIEEGDVVGLEDAWLQFNALGGAPLDLLVGQFQICDPLFKRELRLERFDYEIFKTRVGDAAVNLTYDRGGVLSWHAPAAFEVVVQLVNGNGIEAAQDENFDNDRNKNFALRVARPVGPVRLGVFGYTGKEENGAGVTNRTSYVGPDIVVDAGERWQVNVEYLERRDDDPFFTGTSPGTLETRGGFAEVHYFPLGQDGRIALSALYNRVRSDVAAARFESASLTLNWLLARNVRLLTEIGQDLEADRSFVSVGVVSAF